MLLFFPVRSKLASIHATATAQNAPKKADNVTAKLLPKNKIPAAAPALAPEETPTISGEDNGLRNIPTAWIVTE